MAKIQLTIATEYVKGWSAWEGIREIVQNALDADQDGYAMSVTHSGTMLRVMSQDARLKVDVWLMGVTGKAAEQSLGRAYITCNKNGIPFDPAPFTITSGIRLGTPAGTTRGFGAAEFKEVGALINEVLDGLARNGEDKNGKVEKAVAAKVKKLTAKFPIY